MLSIRSLKEKWAARAEDLVLSSEPEPITGPVRVRSGNDGFVLSLGKQELWAYPEESAQGEAKRQNNDWILLDPDRAFSGVAAFARLENGSELLLGRDNPYCDRIFGFPKSVARRHLVLINIDGQIVLKPQEKDRKTTIALPPEGLERDRVVERNRANLATLRKLYGGPLDLLEASEAMATLDQVLLILSDEAFRQKNGKGEPGGLLTPPEGPTPIIVGDIHAQIENLIAILVQGEVLNDLSRGESYLLFLGDLVHREGSGELEEMDSSLLALDLFFKLKIAFPERVFLLRGNHEDFGGEVGKGGVPQGKLLWGHARALRGKRYAQRLAQFFDQLAFVAKTDDYIACHGGPPRRKALLREVVNIAERPELARDLVWNRLRRTGRPDGYGKGDVKRLRLGLGGGKDMPFIVSHTPLSRDATVWLDAGGIAGHHIVFSAAPGKPALFLGGPRGMVPLELRGSAFRSVLEGRGNGEA